MNNFNLKTISIILFSLISIISFAQDTTIVFDRPWIADSPYLVDKKAWQIETGASYMKKSGLENSYLPSIMLRKYIGWKSELRLTCNYEPQMFSIIKRDLEENIDPIAIGLKHKIFKENEWIPEASMIINTYYPMQRINKIGKENRYNAEASFQFHHNINDRLGLNYNFGGIISNQFTNGILTYSFCLNINPHHHFGFFIEGFGYKPIKNNFKEWGYDAGILFYPTKKSQIDLSIIDNAFDKTHYASLLIGYSILISKK